MKNILMLLSYVIASTIGIFSLKVYTIHTVLALLVSYALASTISIVLFEKKKNVYMWLYIVISLPIALFLLAIAAQK